MGKIDQFEDSPKLVINKAWPSWNQNFKLFLKYIQIFGMNSENFKLCAKLIPSSYVQQGENARKSQEHRIKILLEHVSVSKS